MSKPTAGLGDERVLMGAMQELAGLLLNTESFEQLMQQIAQLTAQTVPGTLTCGITVGNGNRVITVASADDLGAQLDEYQYDLDEGPCLEALRTGQVVSAPDLATDRRWGAYPGIATAHGVAAIHASPLQAAGGTVGVLNLYSDEVGGSDSDTRQHLIAPSPPWARWASAAPCATPATSN